MAVDVFLSQLIGSLGKAGTVKTFSKGEFILKEGDVEHNLYLVEDGAVRLFLLTEFEEHSIRFGFEGAIINSLASYLSGSPSEFYLQALRKTTLRVVPKAGVLELVQRDADTLAAYTSLLEQVIVQQIEREVDLLTASPAQRLQRVLERSPNLFQHVPLRYIASYLRMTPETLSRIRKS